MPSDQSNNGSSYLYPTDDNDDEDGSLASRWKSLKDVFTNAAQKGSQDTQDAADTGNYYLRPTDAAGGEGMLAVAQAASDAISPTDSELKSIKNKQLQAQVDAGVPIIPGQEDMPVAYPDVTAIVAPEVEATRFGKTLGLKGGMKEDAALQNIMEQGVRGSDTANGLGIIDSTGTNNLTMIKNRVLKHLQDNGVTQLADTGIDLLATPQYQTEEKQLGIQPGSSSGLYVPSQNRILVNQNAGDPAYNANTLTHEMQHAYEKKAKPDFSSTPNSKNIGMSSEDYVDKYNDLLNDGDINGAVQLENARKAGHHANYQNFELENALQNLSRYSKDADPEDMQNILNNFPQLRKYFLK